MASRWGLGPVFAYEWLTTSRKWQVYAGRAGFLGLLLAALAVVWVGKVWGRNLTTLQDLAEVGGFFFGAIVSTQMILVLLGAPAATAASICLDRTRGNLAHLMATDLSDAEIVLGKLGARLFPAVGLVACALPLLAICTLLGGVDPQALAGAFLITAGLAVLGCALALTFSVWGSKTHEVLLATYAVWTVWLLSNPVWNFLGAVWGFGPPPIWFQKTNPFWLAYAPYTAPADAGPLDAVIFFAVMIALSGALAILATARVRAVTLRQADRRAASRRATNLGGRRFWALRPALDDEPAYWRECVRRRPTPWMRGIIALYLVLTGTFSILGVVDSLVINTMATKPWIRGWLPAYVNAFQLAFGLPLLLIAAAMTVVEERALGGLEVLMVTPLSTRRLVAAKWLGAFRAGPLLAVLPGLVAGALAWESGGWGGVVLVMALAVAAGASMTSLGLALSTWVRRPGRAISICVIAYTLLALGYPMLLLVTLSGPENMAAELASVSPFHGAWYLTIEINQADMNHRMDFWFWGRIWVAFHLALAAALFLATLATFDRCLGRVPDRPRRPPAIPEPAVAIPAEEELTAVA